MATQQGSHEGQRQSPHDIIIPNIETILIEVINQLESPYTTNTTNIADGELVVPGEFLSVSSTLRRTALVLCSSLCKSKFLSLLILFKLSTSKCVRNIPAC